MIAAALARLEVPLSRRRQRAAVAAAIGLPLLVFMAPALLLGRCLTGSDFEGYDRPHALWAQEALAKDGSVLLWTPSHYGGTAYWGDAQGCNPYVYPPNWLWLVARPEIAYGWLVAFHVLLAAVGTYRLTRRLGLLRSSSALSAVAYGFSALMSARVASGHYGLYLPMALAPLILFFLFRVLRKPDVRRTLEFAAPVGLLLVSGQPMYLYHLLLAGLAFTAWQLAARRREGKPWGRAAGAAVAGATLGGILALGLLWPTLEVAVRSTRAPGPSVYQDLPPRHHAFVVENFLYFLIPEFPWSAKASSLMNRDYAHEKAVFLGILPLLCAAFACGRPLRRGVVFFAALGAAAVLDAMARDVPVHRVLSAVLPAYGSFRVPARAVWIAVLATSVLAGFGWDRLRREQSRLRPFLAGAGSIVLAAAIGTALVLRAPLEALLLLALALGAGAILVLSKTRPGAAALAALTLTAAALLVPGLRRQTYRSSEAIASPPWYAALIPERRSEFRLLNLLAPDLPATAQGFRLLSGCGYPVPASLARYYGTAWKDYSGFEVDSLGQGTELARPEILDRLNVRWIVAKKSLDPRWIEKGRHAEAILFENPGALQAAFLPGGGTASLDRRANRIVVRCQAERGGPLVVSESWMPGWSARMKERSEEVVPYEGALLCAEVPAGESVVEFVYAPRSVTIGLRVSGLAWAGVALGWVFLALRRRAPTRA